MIQNSCFDCHSDNTEFPWYYKLPIINGMIKDHIKEGREHVDFSNDFPFTGKDNILEIMKDIKEEVEDEGMPLLSYRLMHWGKLIQGTQQDSLFDWIDSSIIMIKGYYQTSGIPFEDEDTVNDKENDENDD